MAEATKIQWTDHTFNPWIGCKKISPGCAYCYAEVDTPARHSRAIGLELWGPPPAKRRLTTEAAWRMPLRWEAQAAAEGRRHRVFCASQSDVFEDYPDQLVTHRGKPLWVSRDSYRIIETDDGTQGFAFDHLPCTLDDARARLFDLIGRTPHLDWQMLTKRPENMLRMTYDAWCKPVPGHISQNPGDGRHWHWPGNVWAMTSVENQEAADKRITELLKVPAKVRGLSVEPLLGPVDLTPWLDHECGDPPHFPCPPRPDWVIVGGESGRQARPCHVEWVRSLVQQCRGAGVACFVKQLGGNVRYVGDQDVVAGGVEQRLSLLHPKGGEPSEWPEDLRVREYPTT